ncbi:MAG: hypothetical protein H6842_11285 [Rhodospirillaceae bacterium]|nr:hypothetical protein [Rhodospirillaceae bacterium]
MAIYLNEDEFGNDAACIGFPHILLCMGVVVMTSNDLYGVHLGWPGGDSDVLIAELANLIAADGVADDMRALYGCCNREIRFQAAGDKKRAWKAEMAGYAAILGFAGKIYGFCTSIIAPKDGTYVEYHPQYLQRQCRVYYKRNEKMVYAGGAAPATMHRYNHHRGMVVPFGTEPVTTGAAVTTTPSNKGHLHEVNYVLRMNSFTVP